MGVPHWFRTGFALERQIPDWFRTGSTLIQLKTSRPHVATDDMSSVAAEDMSSVAADPALVLDCLG